MAGTGDRLRDIVTVVAGVASLIATLMSAVYVSRSSRLSSRPC
jgi:hypothetical protein